VCFTQSGNLDQAKTISFTWPSLCVVIELHFSISYALRSQNLQASRSTTMVATTEERRGSMPTEIDVENAGAVATIEKIESEDEFPSFKRVLLIMPALYLSMFLVALVSKVSPDSSHHVTDNVPNRTEPSSEQPSPKSLTNSIQSMMSDGMPVRTCLPLVPSNSSMDGYTPSILQNGSFSLLLPSSRLVLVSSPRPAMSHS
jgi:hypothetical protein